jgi:predicted permease
MMSTFVKDIRYGLRALRRRPGFTATAVLALALGVGANTAVFSFVNALFLQPPPLPEPERLVRLYGSDGRANFSYPNFADLRARSLSFEGLAAHQIAEVSLGAGVEAENAQGEVVTGNYFNVLGARAARGRQLTTDDDANVGAHPVVVISHGMWQRRFNGDPAVVGRKALLNGHPFEVVGVMPEEFRGTYAAFASEFWVPMAMQAQVRPRGLSHLENRGWGWLSGTGRLKTGVTREQAEAEVSSLGAQLREEHPAVNQNIGFTLVPARALPESLNRGASGLVGFVLAVTGLVLLAACANVAGVLLSKVASRTQEIAVRQSLGATRGRLVRQWLTESLLLAALGTAAGLFLAAWIGDALKLLVPPDFTGFAPDLRLDLRVLLFALGLTILTGVLCGLFPALRAGRADVYSALKSGAKGATGALGRTRLQQAFVVAQIAVSLLLLVVAGLLLRSLREAQTFNPGFDAERLLLARFDLSRNGYEPERGAAFFFDLAERLRSQPGVRAAALATVVPLGPDAESYGFGIPGHQPPPGRPGIALDANIVGPGYFEAMGIPVVSGRGFDGRDAATNARPVVVVNETFARKYFEGQDPVGRTLRSGGDGDVEIVGVVRDIKYYSPGELPLPFIYLAFPQRYAPYMTVHVRTSGDPRDLFRTVRREAEALDPRVAVTSLTTLTELRRASLFAGRAMALVSTAFGLLALLLAAVGLYGVMSYAVSRRTHEIGVRVALGASRADVLRLVVGQGMALTLAGVGVGLAASLGLTRLLSGLLFGVSATDPATFAAAALFLAAVALLACYVPARRAMKVDPMEALRHE